MVEGRVGGCGGCEIVVRREESCEIIGIGWRRLWMWEEVVDAFLGFGRLIERQTFSLLYSSYSFPNIIMPIIGGIILDQTGFRVSGLLFGGILALGQAFFVFGVQWKLFSVAIIGRVLFGVGSESFMLVTDTLIVKWFTGRGLSAALSVKVMMDGIFAGFQFVVVPIIIEKLGLSMSLIVSLITCAFSIATLIAWLLLDYWGDRVASSDFFDEDSDSEEDDEDCEFSCEIITSLSRGFWMSSFMISFLYSHSYSFISISEDFLVHYYDINQIDAGYIASLPYFFSVFSAIGGALFDKFGHRGKVMMVTPLLFILSYFLMLYTKTEPGIVWVIFSIAFVISLTASASMAPTFVFENLGTAYGLQYGIYNSLMVVFGYAFGLVIDTFGYRMAIVLSLGITGMQYIVTMALYFYESKRLDMNESGLRHAKRRYRLLNQINELNLN